MQITARVPPILLYFLVALSTFNETVYSAALPNIVKSLHTVKQAAQFSTTAYYLGFALGVFTLGRISDMFGRRPVIIAGISFYAIISLLISYTPNIEIFVILRFLQAYGASVGSVVGQAMTRDSYQGRELSYMYTTIGMIMSVVPSIGSTIGGYIAEYLDWSYIFKSLAISAVCLVFVYSKFLPETNAYISVAKDRRFITVLQKVLQDKILLSYAFIVGTYNGLCFGFYIQAPFIFIEHLKITPSTYGKLFLILSGANLVGSLTGRHLIIKSVNPLKIKLCGFALSVIGGILLLISSFIIKDSYSSLATVILIFTPLTLHLTGHSMVVPILLSEALKNYYKITGSVGSIFGALYYLLTAGITFMISYLHSNNINNYSLLFVVLMTINVFLFYYTTQNQPKNQPRN